MRRSRLLAPFALSFGLLFPASPSAAAGHWVKFSGHEAGTVTVATTAAGTLLLHASGAGSGPHWRAWTSDLHLVYDPVLGQQRGAWQLTFADGTLSGPTGVKYVLAGDANWALVALVGTGDYAGIFGWIYWYGTYAPGGPPGAYTAELYGYIWLP